MWIDTYRIIVERHFYGEQFLRYGCFSKKVKKNFSLRRMGGIFNAVAFAAVVTKSAGFPLQN